MRSSGSGRIHRCAFSSGADLGSEDFRLAKVYTSENAPDGYKAQASILLLSDRISSVYHGTKKKERIRDIKNVVRNSFGISDANIEALIDAVANKTIEILSYFEIEPGDMRPFSQILQEANEELSSLNLSYEMLVMELKQAKEKVEKFAHELKDANEKLRKLVFRDSLTGIYNHRYFQGLMDQELSRAKRYGRQLSLIMFDIDHFKKINDTYGHPRGDLVLKAVSSAVESRTRDSDFVARYGGEEFALVLPETDLNGAIILAERYRKAIEQMEIPAEGQTIKTTISLGVTTYSPQVDGIKKAQVIEEQIKLYTIPRRLEETKSVSPGSAGPPS